jgi:hypothetical protein
MKNAYSVAKSRPISGNTKREALNREMAENWLCYSYQPGSIPNSSDEEGHFLLGDQEARERYIR